MTRFLYAANSALRHVWLLAAIFALASCAPFNKKPAPPQTVLQSLPEQWSSRGKLAIRPVDSAAFKATTANYHWQQTGDATTLQLFGALGMGRVSIESGADGALIRRGDRILSQADSLSNLAWNTLGLPLPTENLRHWLTGRPDPARPYEPLDEPPNPQADTGHQAVGFTQAGWTVEYTLPARGSDKAALPSKLKASDGRIAIRVVIRDWKLGEE